MLKALTRKVNNIYYQVGISSVRWNYGKKKKKRNASNEKHSNNDKKRKGEKKKQNQNQKTPEFYVLCSLKIIFKDKREVQTFLENKNWGDPLPADLLDNKC